MNEISTFLGIFMSFTTITCIALSMLKFVKLSRSFILTEGVVSYIQPNGVVEVSYCINTELIRTKEESDFLVYKVNKKDMLTVYKSLDFDVVKGDLVSVMYDKAHPDTCIVSPSVKNTEKLMTFTWYLLIVLGVVRLLFHI